MRRQRRRNNAWKIATALLLPVLVCMLLRFVFVVRDVQVEGNTGPLSGESVVRAAGAGFGRSIFRVDEEKIASSVNSLGLVQATDVSIRYPDTVRITVQERNKVAMALHMGRMRILDENGCVVESFAEVPDADLIYVSGMRIQGCTTGEVIRAESGQLSAYLDIIHALRQHGASIYVSELNLGNISDIRIITRTGITVKLGSAAKAADKIAWMKSAVADLEKRGEAGGTLDVSSGTKADYRAG